MPINLVLYIGQAIMPQSIVTKFHEDGMKTGWLKSADITNLEYFLDSSRAVIQECLVIYVGVDIMSLSIMTKFHEDPI